jgi:hypothetical protein
MSWGSVSMFELQLLGDAHSPPESLVLKSKRYVGEG